MATVGKIRGIMLTKNEADVVGASIEDALRWIDQVIVYDNRSTDGTWDIVQGIAERDPRVVPWKQHDSPFREGLRAEPYAAILSEARKGDWWCRLDSDEFYIDPPREFLGKISGWHHVVWSLHVEHYLTEEDVATLDFSLPFEQLRPRIMHYRVSSSEARFFRHRDRLAWPSADPWPRHMGIVAPERIRLRHYKYRSPQQIQTRLDVRREARRRGFVGWEHASQEDWREKISRTQDCHVDDGSGQFKVVEGVLPYHLESPAKRAAKYLMHGLGLWP